MPLSDQAKKLIAEEEAVLTATYTALEEQLKREDSKFRSHTGLARDLTSSIVETRRVEDKVQLYSDEAVSHALKDRKQSDVKQIEKLMERPYFGRLKVKEERGDKEVELEYKIGFNTNNECRIVDWRKSAISKLYYEYRQGDDYSEEIQGQERAGTVLLRHSVEVERDTLKKLNCPTGEFIRKGDEWIGSEGGDRSRPEDSSGGLQNILTLITPEQFKMITEEATTAVLIQGIAGSGKTTVALHRLAWLLHKDNSDITADQTLVLVQNNTLKRYIADTLPAIGIHGVRYNTYDEWAREALIRFSVITPATQLSLEAAPSSVERTKRSLALLKVVEKHASSSSADPFDVLLTALLDARSIVEMDHTKLIDKEIITWAHQRTKENIARGVLDRSDLPLLLRIMQIRHNGVPLPSGTIGKWRHIVLDEVQDLSSIQLATAIAAVEELHQLTIVGDTAQQIDEHHAFPGWELLRTHWGIGDDLSRFVSLSVSHRSTIQIMRLADHVLGTARTTTGREGYLPVWYRTRGERQGLMEAISWLSRVREKRPNALIAVICADYKAAKMAFSMLEPTFESSIRLGDDDTFSFESGIVVCAAKQVKGLEFHSVLLWNPDANSFSDSALDRQLLYVAITRAQYNLAIVGWGSPTRLLPTTNQAVNLLKIVFPEVE